MDRSAILNKIKKLQILASRGTGNEAENAQKLADDIIGKYNVSEEELSSIKEVGPLYGEDDKIFSTVGVVPWKQQLILAITKYLDKDSSCYVIQEESVPAEGEHEFSYFLYGEDDDVFSIRKTFLFLEKKIDELALKYLFRGSDYVSSYCEGVVHALKENLQNFGIAIPKMKKIEHRNEEISQQGPGLVKSAKTTPKEKISTTSTRPENRVTDILAFFTGVQDGYRINLDELILETEEVPKIDT
jgi:hypothetical protein